MPDDGRWGQPLEGLSIRARPENIQAEHALLGAILANNKALDGVLEFLRPDHFADPIHGHIYKAIVSRNLRGEVADAITLKGDLEHSGILDAVGGTRYLASLLTAMVGILHARDYAIAILEDWRRRELIAAAEVLVNSVYADGVSPREAAEAAVAAIERAQSAGQVVKSAATLDMAMDAALAHAEAQALPKGPNLNGTGFPSIDKLIGGLDPSTLTVLGGRPGMGKTALGWQMCLHIARQSLAVGGTGVVAISQEMSGMALGRRALAAESKVPVGVMKYGSFTVEQANRMVAARRALSGLPLRIEDGGAMTMAAMRIKLRQQRRALGGRLSLVMIDHIHLAKPDEASARQGPAWAVGQVAHACLDLAKEFECPILALAQLGRGTESRDDKRPTLADLRWSGDIEQDADNVLFVYREEYYLGRGEIAQGASESGEKFQARKAHIEEMRGRCAGQAEVIAAKLRDGDPGTAKLNFDGPSTSFSDPRAHDDGAAG